MQEILSGLIGNSGIAKGRAIVVMDASDGHKVHPGDIIIARFTHPTVTPYLIGASALVTDVGGLLCHAAVIAREMGIPAVVGTKSATSIVRDGDTLLVDATHGKVYRLEIDEA